MKRTADDIANWKLQQENMSKPFPYVFPQMPPRFRRYYGFTKVLFLMEWGCIWTVDFGVIMGGAVMLFRGAGAFREGSMALLMGLVLFVPIPLYFLCRWLRNTPKHFWHCPCCGQPFPYYAPPLLRGSDELKEADCLYSMEHLRIKYVKTRFCPLIAPSVCPDCKCKFFDMGGDFPADD